LADWLSKAYLLVILRYLIDGAIIYYFGNRYRNPKPNPKPKPNLNPKPNPNPNGMFEI
jgi:hypothetical protein